MSTSVNNGYPLTEYKIQTVLSRSKCSIVFLVKNRETGELFVMKMIKNSLENVHREVFLQNYVLDMGILPIQRVFFHNEKYFLVMKYHKDGDVLNRLLSGMTLTFSEKMQITRCLVGALNKLHASKIAHCDLKLENVVLFYDGGNIGAVLIDFEHSHLNTIYGTIKGTPPYMPPEAISKLMHEHGVRTSHHDIRSDMWSLGVLIFTLFAEVPPFHFDGTNKDMTRMFGSILKVDYLHEKKYLKFPVILSLVERLLVFNPEDRMTIDEVHTYLQNYI